MLLLIHFTKNETQFQGIIVIILEKLKSQIKDRNMF